MRSISGTPIPPTPAAGTTRATCWRTATIVFWPAVVLVSLLGSTTARAVRSRRQAGSAGALTSYTPGRTSRRARSAVSGPGAGVRTSLGVSTPGGRRGGRAEGGKPPVRGGGVGRGRGPGLADHDPGPGGAEGREGGQAGGCRRQAVTDGEARPAGPQPARVLGAARAGPVDAGAD